MTTEALAGRASCTRISLEKTMYDHIGLRVGNLDASVRFYTAALAPLGYVLCSRDDSGAGGEARISARAGISSDFGFNLAASLIPASDN